MIISFVLYYVIYIYIKYCLVYIYIYIYIYIIIIIIIIIMNCGKVGKINVTNNYPKPEIIVTTLPSNNIE